MPKTDKKTEAVAKPKTLYAVAPWNAVHKRDGSTIEAYVEAAGDWQTIATVQQTAHIAAEPTANFIVKAVNDYEASYALILEMAEALELCLTCEGLSWEAEREAEILAARAKQRIPSEPNEK